MHEAIFKYRLGDRARALGDAIESGKLGLHIGRKTGIGRRVYIHRLGSSASHIEHDPVLARFDPGADLPELSQYRFEEAWAGIFKLDASTCHSRSRQIGPR